MLFRHSASHLLHLLLHLLLLATIAACQQTGHSNDATPRHAVGKIAQLAQDWASSCIPASQTQHIKFTDQNGKVHHAYVDPSDKNSTLQAQEPRVLCTTDAEDDVCTPCDVTLGHVELMDPGTTYVLAVKTNTGHASIEVLSRSDGRVRIDGVPIDVFCYTDDEKVSRELETEPGISPDANATPVRNANNVTAPQLSSHLELAPNLASTPGCWPVPSHVEIKLETKDVHIYSLFIEPNGMKHILNGANPQAQCLQTSTGDKQYHCNHCAFQTKYAYVKGEGHCGMKFKKMNGGFKAVTLDQDFYTFQGDEWPWEVTCWKD